MLSSYDNIFEGGSGKTNNDTALTATTGAHTLTIVKAFWLSATIKAP